MHDRSARTDSGSAHIARAYIALDKDRVEEVNARLLRVTKGYGFANVGLVSSDTTAQGLPIGYPNEPGILRGLPSAKAGKKVECGLLYLLSRLGGGYVFGTLIRGVVDESKMPLQALAGYRAIFGPHATLALVVYDRGGDATATLKALANEGSHRLASSPKASGRDTLPRQSVKRSGANAARPRVSLGLSRATNTTSTTPRSVCGTRWRWLGRGLSSRST